MANDDTNRQSGGSSTIAFDETELEEAIRDVRVIGLTLVTMGMNAHPGDTVPVESISWFGGHLSAVGDRLNQQYDALHAERH